MTYRTGQSTDRAILEQRDEFPYVTESIAIDIDTLREDLKQECYGAFFDGGFGGALIESFDIERTSPEKLVEIAEKRGVDLKKYKA